MNAGPRISFVLPAHNEIGLLGSTVTNLITGVEGRGIAYEIIVVENGSRDGTLRLARILAAQLPHVRVLALPRGNYGAALVAGFWAATGEVVVNFDVDYYDLGFLDQALEALSDGATLVLASKRAPDAHDRRPIVRRLLTFVFAMVLRVAIGLEVSDAHGMKAMDRVTVTPYVDRCRLRGAIYDVELTCRIEQAGLSIIELPATVIERRPPRSSVLLRSFEAIGAVVRLRMVLRRERLTTPIRPR